MKRSSYLAVLLLLATSAAWGQSWYGLQENGLEPNYRDQDGFGTCWTFGTMASVETNLIKEGLLPQNTSGLSERDLAWHSGYGAPSIPGTAAAATCRPRPISPAATDLCSTLRRRIGVVPAAERKSFGGEDPFPNSTTPSPLPRSSRPAASYYVRDIEWLHSTADIKNAILTYGAVSTCWAVDRRRHTPAAIGTPPRLTKQALPARTSPTTRWPSSAGTTTGNRRRHRRLVDPQ